MQVFCALETNSVLKIFVLPGKKFYISQIEELIMNDQSLVQSNTVANSIEAPKYSVIFIRPYTSISTVSINRNSFCNFFRLMNLSDQAVLACPITKRIDYFFSANGLQS